jgi:hypothetical protein
MGYLKKTRQYGGCVLFSLNTHILMALLFRVCFSDFMFLSLAFFTPNSAPLYV